MKGYDMSAFFYLSAEETRRLLPFDELIEALRGGFISGCEVPLRHHHTINIPGEPDATLLLMPAWNGTELGGIKLVNVNPGNADRGMGALSASYLLFDVKTGHHLAMLDGGEITARRTVAASALAASYLARPDAETLLVVGGGRLGSLLAYAYRAVRPIRNVIVWGRNLEKCEILATQLNRDGFNATGVTDLRRAVAKADIMTCATLSRTPLVKGEWLKPGQHLDLIGGFTPLMREADDEAIRRSSVFIDTDGAFSESGDIIDPIKNGVLSRQAVKGDLYDLCRNAHGGRRSATEITLFKAVGTALADLAAATLAYRKFERENNGA
jgi:ornithine cyclodeaminase/alanine dehydrogenase-like protein (mu-crystallin family)